MSSAAYVDEARRIASDLEREERAAGLKASDARKRIARRLGCMPGTLTNLALGRLKKIEEGFIARLHAERVRVLTERLQRASHEMDMAIQIGIRRDCAEMAHLEAAMQKAQKLLTELNNL